MKHISHSKKKKKCIECGKLFFLGGKKGNEVECCWYCARRYLVYGILSENDYRKGRVNLEKKEFAVKVEKNKIARSKFIEKRCDRCTEIFLIPFVREGSAQRQVCAYAICPFCNPNADKCKDCFVPYKVKAHYALGCCKMCYYRHLNNTKTE